MNRLSVFLRVLIVALATTLPSTAVAQAQDSAFASALARGPLYLGLAAFGFGLLVSLTPCVYPMVAITVSVFGARQATSRPQALLLSAAFVLGVVAMFVPLGVVAAMTGRTFGTSLSSPWVVVSLATLFLALAASMFGAFELDLPSGLKNRLAGAGGGGYLGAFVLGLACGPIAAPCTGPFLYGLLAWIAQTQSVTLGTAAMTAFALGLGTPFFLVGAFALNLPKGGMWMVHVKSIMGIVLVVVALYFLGNAFPVLRAWAQPGTSFLLAMGGLVVVGVLLGAVHKSFEAVEWGTRLSKGLGVVLVSGGLFGGIAQVTTAEHSLSFETPAPGEDLAGLLTRARQTARQEGRPVFIDFTAAWCVACKEIELHTFPDPTVAQAAGRFVAIKADMTDDSDPAVERTSAEFGIRGLPTLLLLDSRGEEVKRFVGSVVDPKELSAAMDAIR